MLVGVLNVRPVAAGDEEAYAAVVNAIHADESVEPRVLRHRWELEGREPSLQGRFLIVDGTAVCGLAFWRRPADWPPKGPKVAVLNVRMVPTCQSPSDFGRILSSMEDAARAAGATIAQAITREDEEFHPRELVRRGYVVDRVSRNSRLDLRLHARSLIAQRAASRRLMSGLGVAIQPVGAQVAAGAWRELYALTTETVQDIPSTFVESIAPFDHWVAAMSEPGMDSDRIWTARSRGSLVGYTYLKYAADATATTGYTCTRKRLRGLGVGRAMKLESIGQAIELGRETISTNNDLANTPILKINEDLGFAAEPGLVIHVKHLAEGR